MPELRKDPIVDRWVIIAKERGQRPHDFKPEPASPGSGFCPFCSGHEGKTPAEVWAIRENGSAPNSEGWQVRVVPNKFPALAIEGGLDRQGLGMFDMMNGVGAHEVIVETPNHDWKVGDATEEELSKVLWAYRERLLDLQKDLRFRYCLVFRNYGQAAGASLAHPHSQLIAIAITPKRVKEELNAARDWYLEKERCIFCDVLRQELAMRDRVVLENDHFAVLSPFASRFPFEVNILPKRHSHDFTTMTDQESVSLARTLRETMKRIEVTLQDPPYNYVLHTAPNAGATAGPPRADRWTTLECDFHWHIEIVPRLTKIAGFEWGTGFYINPVAPEQSTRFLQEAIIVEEETPTLSHPR
ncbi:MAG: galactose-1-phosphate uridylyltransferase [Armatimonadetes bacterium]|nr:galactose-1-phosphate uridylyltransferase [Armatimonadota bacterium]